MLDITQFYSFTCQQTLTPSVDTPEVGRAGKGRDFGSLLSFYLDRTPSAGRIPEHGKLLFFIP
jgi:hypothetical protein